MRHLRQRAGVIGMFVGNQNGVNAVAGDAQVFEAAVDFFFAEPGIHQETSPLGFEQRGVARAPRRQDRNLQTYARTPLWIFR